MRSGGKICLSTGNRKCKGPEAGKSAPRTMNKLNKRKRNRKQRSKGQNRQGLEGWDKDIGFLFKCDWKPLKVLHGGNYRSDFHFKKITLLIL